jgi:dienelactone hydrolase
MRLGLLAIGVAIAAFSDVANAQNVDKSLDAIDFLVDAPDLIGKRVTVTGCSFWGATMTSVVCRAPNGTGSIYIQSDSLERESLRRALKTCTRYEQAHCRGSVTGVVSSGIFGPRLEDATIEWAQ